MATDFVDKDFQEGWKGFGYVNFNNMNALNLVQGLEMQNCGLTSTIIATGWSTPKILSSIFESYTGDTIKFMFHDNFGSSLDGLIKVEVDNKLWVEKSLKRPGEYLQMFAHSLDPNEPWPGLVEKAFLRMVIKQANKNSLVDDPIKFDDYDKIHHYPPMAAIFNIVGINPIRIDVGEESIENIRAMLMQNCQCPLSAKFDPEETLVVYASRTPTTITSVKEPRVKGEKDPLEPKIDPNHHYPLLGLIDGDTMVLRNQLQKNSLEEKNIISGKIMVVRESGIEAMETNPSQNIFLVRMNDLKDSFSLINYVEMDKLRMMLEKVNPKFVKSK